MSPTMTFDPSPEPEPDLEGLVIDALEALPPPFAERLGSVAIVIEEEPTADQLASVGARGLFGLYHGIPRTAYGAGPGGGPQQDHDLPRPALRAYRTPEALAAGVTDTVHHEIAHHFGISDARLHELQGGRASSDASRPSTTGRMRSTHSAYWAPDGWRPSDGDQRAVLGGARRQVEDVDEGDPPLGGERRHRRVVLDDRGPALVGLAVVGTGRASRCSRGSRR